MFIRSERLFLRPVWPEDGEELFAGTGAETVMRNPTQAPWPCWPNEAHTAIAFPAMVRPDLPKFIVTLPTECGPVLVGGIGLYDRNGVVELGGWLRRDYQGRGYATEAGRAVLGLARMLGHRHIHATPLRADPACARVLAKLGFRPMGRGQMLASRGRARPASSACYTVDVAAKDGGDIDPRPEMQAA